MLIRLSFKRDRPFLRAYRIEKGIVLSIAAWHAHWDPVICDSQAIPTFDHVHIIDKNESIECVLDLRFDGGSRLTSIYYVNIHV